MLRIRKFALAALLSVATQAALGASPSYLFRTVIPGLQAQSTTTGSTDPYYSSVVSLLSLDTPSGSPAIADAKGNSWSATNVALSNSQYAVGTGALAFTTTTSHATGPTFTLSGDFTVEAWVYPTVSNTWLLPIMGQWNQASAPGGWIVGLNASNNLVFYWNSYGGATPFLTGGSVPLSQWSHVAVSRQGTTFREFVNGTLVQSASSSAAVLTSTVPITLGDYFSSSGIFPASGVTNLQGYLQQVRITNGVARYTTSFTPSMSADPTQ